MTPTPEQAAFRQALLTTTSSILLEARAGSGKTKAIIDNLDAVKGKKALLAFNRKIADELKARVARLDLNTRLETQVATTHSFGLSALRRAGYRVKVEKGKVNFLLKDMLENYDFKHPLVRSKPIIRQLVSSAKASAFGCTSIDPSIHYPPIDGDQQWLDIIDHFLLDTEIAQIWGEEQADEGIREVVRLSRLILKQSNARLTQIDFDDMLYLPLLLDAAFERFKAVFIDEAQDTNIVRQELAFRMLAEGGRLITVGDPFQAIYGFTGADAIALQRLAKRSKAITLPLTVCWRCDQRIIEFANRWVSDIISHDTEGKGLVDQVEFGPEFIDRLQPRDAILCRLNKPNVAVAIALLRAGKTPRIEGRDLGQTLLKHARLANPEMPALDVLVHDLEEYRQHQINLLTAREKHKQAAYLDDEIDATAMLIERCLEQGKKTYYDLEMLTQSLFVDEASAGNAIVLSSVHKAKGLEWPRVYLLGRGDYMPFHRAAAEWELEQERNLIYVAITRAEHELIEVTGVQSALDKGLHRQQKRVTMSPADEKPTPAPSPDPVDDSIRSMLSKLK